MLKAGQPLGFSYYELMLSAVESRYQAMVSEDCIGVRGPNVSYIEL
jgi:hypothetical protein